MPSFKQSGAYLDEVRAQLEKSGLPWTPENDHVFLLNGGFFGFSFAEIRLHANPAAQVSQLVFDLNMAIPTDRLREARRFLKRTRSQTLRYALAIDDEGWVHLDTGDTLRSYDDLLEALASVGASCLAQADQLFAISCGARAWELEEAVFSPDPDYEPDDETGDGNASAALETAVGNDGGTDAPCDLAALLNQLIR